MNLQEFHDKFRGKFRAFIMDCWAMGKEGPNEKARLADGLLIKLDELMAEMHLHFNPGTPLPIKPEPKPEVKPQQAAPNYTVTGLANGHRNGVNGFATQSRK
jgi:hypothetical protein